MLLGDSERILADHQVPTHRRLTCCVGTSVADLQGSECLAPANLWMMQTAERRAGLQEKEVIVVNLASGCAEKGQLSDFALLGATYPCRLLPLVALEKFVAHVSEELR